MNHRRPDHEQEIPSAGVEALIQRLKDEGVAAGRERAEQIVSEAETRARWMVEQAQAEAEEIRAQGRRDVDRYRIAAEEALRTAARDTILSLKVTLSQRFAREIERLVSSELKDETLLKRLILEIAGSVRTAVDTSTPLEVLLPQNVVGLEDLRQNPEELQKGPLTHFVLAVTRDILREGVTFNVTTDHQAGIKIQLADAGVAIDLTEHAITQLLLQHLHPRFRALLEGIVK
jgi:V/A-type H+-transporting ATPase subunit E